MNLNALKKAIRVEAVVVGAWRASPICSQYVQNNFFLFKRFKFKPNWWGDDEAQLEQENRKGAD